jgi:hypothetical protein
MPAGTVQEKVLVVSFYNDSLQIVQAWNVSVVVQTNLKVSRGSPLS